MTRVVAYCDDPDCRCLDRGGVILYDGPSREEAEAAKEQAPAGYAVEMEEITRWLPRGD